MSKNISSKAFAGFLALMLLLQFIPLFAVTASAEPAGQLMILQTYGGGKNQNGTPISHSFIELYNASGDAVDLAGWKVVYHDERTAGSPVDWEAALPTASLASCASFLIRGQALTGLVSPAYSIDNYDLDLPGNWLDNKTYSVKLLNPNGDVVNEMTNLDVPNKHTSLRRVDFGAAGFVEVDYRTTAGMTAERLAELAPRSLADGSWGTLGSIGTTSPTVDLNSAVIINQVYGRLTDGAVSHGFIELYNRSSDSVDLSAYSLQYAESGAVWQTLHLLGTLEPYHSYLVRCLPGNNDGNHRYLIADYDMEWNIQISNRALKVALVGNHDALTVKNPTVDDGVLDLVGAYNSASDPWDYAAGSPVEGMSKQKSVRRNSFANTGDNSADFSVVDYRVPPAGISDEVLAQARPRWTGEGEENVYSSDITGLAELWFDGSAEAAASYSDGRKATDLVRWQKINGRYHLIVPQSADINSLKVFYKASAPVMVGAQRIVLGQATNVFAGGGDFVLSCGGIDYPITVRKTSAIPTMFITTESGNMDSVNANQSNREAGRILLVEKDGATVSYNGTLDRINGRGNATWEAAKKPYNIKLSKSTSLLGMIRHDKWSLLANHYDASHMRNALSHSLAEYAGLDFTSKLEPVDLYVNNEYLGLYSLVERREVGGAVNITNLEKETEKANDGADLSTFPRGGLNMYVPNTYKYFKIPKDPADITGGYLIEYELDYRYKNEVSGFVTKKGQAVTLTSPEYASKRQVQYIRAFVQDMENAIYSSSGYNRKGKHYTDYVDEESLAKMYLLQEYTMNVDAGVTSCFFYKESDLTGDGKLHAAPAWDFDVAFGNSDERDTVNLKDPNLWWANRGRIRNALSWWIWTPHIFTALCKHAGFKDAALRQWQNVYAPLVETMLNPAAPAASQGMQYIGSYADSIRESANINNLFWGTGDFGATASFVHDFAQKRAAFMNQPWEWKGPLVKGFFGWLKYILYIIKELITQTIPNWFRSIF